MGGGGWEGAILTFILLFADYNSPPGDGSVSVVTVEGFHHSLYVCVAGVTVRVGGVWAGGYTNLHSPLG